MPKQLEIDFTSGDEPRKLIKARVQNLASSSLSESTSHVTMPGKISTQEPNEIGRSAKTKKRSYTVSSLF